MNLIKIADEVFVRPDEVVSVERDTTYEWESSSPSDSNIRVNFDGSRIILKNGRKIFIRNVFPEAILKTLGIEL